MSAVAQLSQVRHSIGPLCVNTSFRLKVTLYSPKSQKLFIAEFTNYDMVPGDNNQLTFKNLDFNIPKDHKILVNVKDSIENTHQRAIYFDEVINSEEMFFYKLLRKFLI